MDDLQDLSVEISLKSVDYLVNIELVDNTKFILEIQSIQTAEIWKGCFDSNYIEDLTRKTGNFKAFPIFLNMLYAALKQDSSTVALDILTYSDLEMLRGKKDTSNTSKTTNNKRYLILTYNVEFDRITYPLHLNYQGVPDPIELLKTIRKLRSQVKSYENHTEGDYRSKENQRLEKENANLLKEKEFMALEVLKIKCENQRKAKEQSMKCNESNTQQEIKVLKQMMKGIEESSIKEKNYFQRQIIKKDEELNTLRYQISQIKANEKSLMSQIKFSEEKFRNRSRNTSINDSFKKCSQNLQRRSNSQDSLKRSESRYFNYNYINTKKSTQPKSRYQSDQKMNAPSAQKNGTRSRWRSNSLDRSTRLSNSRGVSPANSRRISPASSINSLNSCGSAYSVNGSKKRFNPTDYVRAKKEKTKVVEQKRKQEIRYKICGNQAPRNQVNMRTRSRSVNSNYSYDGDNYDSSSYLPRNKDTSFASNYSTNRNSRKKPDTNGSTLFNRDQEMKEIDEKLKSLQMLIKNSS